VKRMLFNSLGKIDIAAEVISAIAGQSTLQSNGVVDMAARKIQEGLGNLIGKQSPGKGVEVLTIGEGTVRINLYIIIQYGMKVSGVSQEIMEKVKLAVESTTGLLVERVNVFVQGVQEKNEKNSVS